MPNAPAGGIYHVVFEAQPSCKQGLNKLVGCCFAKNANRPYNKSLTARPGVMMWKQQALAYWESLAGGSLSSELAEAKWAELVATIDDHIHDQKGPTKAPLRFRVRTEDIVDLSSAYLKRKCLGSFVSVCPLFLFIVQVSLSLKLESLVCDLSLD